MPPPDPSHARPGRSRARAGRSHARAGAGPRARLIALAIALGAAFAAHAVRGERGIDRTLPAADREPALVLGEPAAMVRAHRVARAVEGRGWVPSREPRIADGRGARDAPPPVPWGPGYDLALAAVHRRALPSLAHLMTPADGRRAAPPPGPGERARIEGLVAAAPPVLAALTALLAALLAHLAVLASGGPAAGAALSAGAAGLAVAFPWPHVQATARGVGGAAGWTGLLLLASLAVVVRSWRRAPIQQPFWSSLRGALAGLLAGLAMLSDGDALVAVLLLQLAFLARLLLPFRDGSGAFLPARAFPVFATSFHKVALLVVLPAMIENPGTIDAAWGANGVSWLHFACVGVGWLAFAPYALAPRLVSRRPLVALLPALVAAGAVAAFTGAPAGVAGLLAPPAVDPGALAPAFVVLPFSAAAVGRRARRAPELVPLLVLGTALPALVLLGSTGPGWALAPGAALLGAGVGPLFAAASGRAPGWAAPLLAGALLLGAAFDPRTLGPDPRPDGPVDAEVQRALMDLDRRVAGAAPPPRVLAEPALGSVLLWRTGLSPAAVDLGDGRVVGDASPLRPGPDPAARAGELGFGWVVLGGLDGEPPTLLQLPDPR